MPSGSTVMPGGGTGAPSDMGRLPATAERAAPRALHRPCTLRVPKKGLDLNRIAFSGVNRGDLWPQSATQPAMLLGAPGMDLGPLPPHTVRSADDEPLSSSFEALFGLDGVL